MLEFHGSRTACDRYQSDESLFSLHGNAQTITWSMIELFEEVERGT